MKYRKVPKSNIEIPSYMELPVFAIAEPKVLARSLRCLRRIREIHFGGAK